jgi:Cft2 family RNA processing exonuclease
VLKNKKEMEEIGRARNLLKAGRERNQDRMFKSLYDGKRKEDLNSTINQKGTIVNPSKWERQEAVKRAQLTNPNKVKKSIAEHEKKAAELRAKKEAGEQLKKNLKKGGKIALATGGVVAAGIGAKKLVDKKKAKKESDKKD